LEYWIWKKQQNKLIFLVINRLNLGSVFLGVFNYAFIQLIPSSMHSRNVNPPWKKYVTSQLKAYDFAKCIQKLDVATHLKVYDLEPTTLVRVSNYNNFLMIWHTHSYSTAFFKFSFFTLYLSSLIFWLL